MSGIEDRLLVERLLNMYLVPFSLESSERMKKLFMLFATVDENAGKAFIEVTCKNYFRSHYFFQCNISRIAKSEYSFIIFTLAFIRYKSINCMFEGRSQIYYSFIEIQKLKGRIRKFRLRSTDFRNFYLSQ